MALHANNTRVCNKEFGATKPGATDEYQHRGASRYGQKQQQVAAAVSVIIRKDIRTYGWRTLNEALASLPGIYGTYDYLGVRGLSLPGDFNTRALITINGNRINDATYDQGPTGRDFPLDIDLIERIEFIPEPGSAVYGQNAMGYCHCPSSNEYCKASDQ